MTIEPREFHTAIATLTRVRTDLVEIHYKPGCTLAIPEMAEVQAMRRGIMGTTPYGMITFIPGDIDFELPTMQVDHLETDRKEGQVIATAVVARANMVELLVKLYFSYFPQLHRIRVTDNEQEARAWLDAQMEESTRTGS
ncbi:MAG: hypothetical protein IPK99_16905 [Flavobacteriales bacterium]|nr:hypothetical protein [Flavobacteriales bacterium]